MNCGVSDFALSRCMTLRVPVRELVERHDLVLSDDVSGETLAWAETLILSFSRPAQDDEAAMLLGLLSRSDDDCYGLNWSIMHFIETAPNWPDWSVLATVEGEWAARLRTGALNAGHRHP